MPPALYTFGVLLLVLTRKVESVTVEQSSSQVVKEGTEELRIDCSHDDSNLQRMLWYQHQQSGRSMSFIGYTVYDGEPNYEEQFKDSRFQIKGGTMRGSLIIRKVNSSDSAVYFCAASKDKSYNEAYFGAGTKLTVLEKDLNITRPTVKVLRPSPKECRNQKDDVKKKTIVCVASGFYPDHVGVFWDIDGENVTTGVATDEAALRKGNNYTITSRLRVSAKEWFTPTKTFTCTVSFFNGTHTVLYSGSIKGKEAKGDLMTREKYLKITQSAKLSYTVFIIKSSIYGAFVAFLVWKLQSSAGKQNN